MRNYREQGHYRVSAGGNSGPKRQKIDGVQTILSARDKVLIILEVPRDIDFLAFMKKNYDRLRRANFQFRCLDGGRGIPYDALEVLTTLNETGKWVEKTIQTGWENHSRGPNF